MVTKKDIKLLMKNTSDTITQRLWGNHKLCSKIHLKEIIKGDQEMTPENQILSGEEFWKLLANYIKASTSSFQFSYIDLKLKTFTAEEKFPVQFWNTAKADTKENLLQSVDSHWMLAQNYDLINKTNFSSDLFLENIIKINNGKEKISSLFHMDKKETITKNKSGNHHLNLI